MHEQSALERSYRRLLLAYPRFYRSERGLEILTTMLDGAKPGQVRATRAEAVHLLLSGLRCRLAPPGRAGKLAAGVVTLWMAVVLSGVGAYFAWSTGPGLDDPAIAAFSDTLVGQPASRVSFANADPLDMAYTYKSSAELQTLAAEGWGGARPVPAGSTRVYAQATQTQAVLADAQRRLRNEGWQIGDLTRPKGCACSVFWAGRDGLLLRMSATAEGGPRSGVVVRVYQAEPGGVLAAAVAGFVIGLLGCWPVMAWLGHRFRRATPGARLLIVLFGLPALYACVANTVDSVLSMVPDPDADGLLLAADLMYPLANQVTNPLAAIVIVLGLAAGIVLTRWPRRIASVAGGLRYTQN